MRTETHRVLLVDDERSLREPLSKFLRENYALDVDTAASYDEACAQIAQAEIPYDVVLIDDLLIRSQADRDEPAAMGIELMGQVKQQWAETECIIFTGWGMDRGMAALKAGAYRYLPKSANPDELAITIQMAAQKRRLQNKLETTEREKDWLQTFLKIGQAITSTLALNEVLNLIVTSAVEAFPAALNGGLHLYDPDSGKLFIQANTFGYSQDAIKAASLEPGEGIAGWVYQKQEPLVVSNALQDPRYKRINHPEFFDYRSMICVPLRARERVLGTLSLTNRDSDYAFANDDLALLSIFSDQAAIAIENARLYEDGERRQRLLEALDEASRKIRAEKEIDKLLPEVVRLAAELVNGTASGLFVNRVHIKELELQAVYGLPQTLVGHRLPYGQSLVGHVAQSGEAEVERIGDYQSIHDDMLTPIALRTRVAVPLRVAGNVEAVLLVADDDISRTFTRVDIEILERFVAQASVALQTSRLLSREQRMYHQLAILHKISDYIETARDLDTILHVVLTGITAGYGLCFNRAALLFLDEKREYLMGRMGIGHLTTDEAKGDWEQHHKRGLEDFGRYLDKLEAGLLPLTPVGERTRALQLRLGKIDEDIFARVIRERQPVRLSPENMEMLPAAFVKAFEPDHPLIIIPLLARDEPIGLLIADNKFTKTPITAEDIESLLTFCNTAAVAITNVQLFQAAEAANERLRLFYGGSNALVSSGAPEEVLQEIVEQAQSAAEAAGVSMILIDDMAQVQDVITAGMEKPAAAIDLIRPDGLSMAVMRSGRYEVIEDASHESQRINPSPFWNDLAAGLCLPVSVEGKRIGVMWFHYYRPRHFSASEIEAAQLYVNQAAIAYDTARRMRELKHMHQAAKALASAAGLTGVLTQVVQSACEVLQADSAFIWSYDASRKQFDLDNSVAAGIPSDTWKEFQKIGPRPGGTAETVMKRGWIGVKSIVDTKQYPFIGPWTRQLLNAIGTQSFQGLSLNVEDEPLGVLYVNYDRPRSFSEEERQVAQTFANLAAQALKRARLFDKVSKAYSTAHVVTQVTALEDLQKTLNSVVQGTVAVLGCDAVTLYVYNLERDQLIYPPTHIGLKYPKRIARLSGVAEDSIIIEMLRRQEPYLVKDATIDPLFKDRRFVQEEKITSCLAVPLKAGDVKVGVMFINYRQPHQFIADELDDIQLFALQAAVAIRNAQLYEAVQRRLAVLHTLYDASLVVTSSLQLDEILSRIARQAWQLLSTETRKAQYSVLALLDNRTLYFRAAYPHEKLAKLQAQVGHIKIGSEERVGIVGRVARTGLPQRVDDVTQDTDYINQDSLTASQLAAPIKVGEEMIGVISVEHRDRHAFTEGDQQALALLAAQASVAIQNARLYQKVNQRAEQFQTLYQANLKLRAELSLPTVLQEIADYGRKLTGAQYGVMNLVDENGQLKHFMHSGLNAKIAERVKTLPDNQGLLGLLLREPQSIRVNNAGQHPAFSGFPPYHPEMHSFLGVPILSKDKFIGSLYMANKQGVPAFSQEDQEMLELLGLQAAIVIENARLFEQTERHARLLDMAARVAREATATLEIDELLTDTACLIGDYFGLYHVGIFLLDKGGEYAELQASHPQVEEGMLKRGHKLRVGQQGIIGHVMATGRFHIAHDVSQDKYHLFNPQLPNTRFEAVFPLKARGQVIGALDIQSQQDVALAEEDVATLQLMADQLANAIHNARLFQEVSERLREVEALRQVAIALTGASETGKIFEIVVKEAMKLTGTDESSILFWDAQTEQFVDALRIDVNNVVQRYQTQARSEGGRARQIIDTRRPIAIYDAQQVADFNPAFVEKGYRSSLGVPLQTSETVYGVLYARGNQPRQFSEEEIVLFEALASQAAVAIDRARNYEEMRKIKGFIGSHTAIDWIKMVSWSWGHSIRREVGTTLGRVALLRNLLSQEHLPPEVQQELKQLENTIRNIKEIPILAPLSYEDAVDAVHVNELIKTYLERQWQHVRYKPVKLHFKLQRGLDDKVTVWASQAWLRRGLEIPIDNAVEAMAGSDIAKKEITISTQLVRNMVEISIQDTGPGIPEYVQAKLFKEPIPRPEGSKGAGIGLMLAQTIFQTYWGDIKFTSASGSGTTVSITLPARARE